jgi:hypothetical protein
MVSSNYQMNRPLCVVKGVDMKGGLSALSDGQPAAPFMSA